MNLLSRAKLSGRIRLFSLQSVTPLQQLNLYSTKTTQESSVPSSNFSERIKKHNGEQIVWPKPREIPYQSKVANFVNLIGYVKTPVHFEAASDGKHLAATVISQEIIGDKESLLIPVVFEGDLAHVVYYHVKENNCVLVSGQLSTEPLRVALSHDGLGMFHIVAENLNFVEGFGRNVARKKLGVSFSGVEIEKSKDIKIENVVKMMDNDEEFKFNQQWRDSLEHAKVKRFSGDKDCGSSSLNSEAAKLDFVEPKPEKCDVDRGESGVKKKYGNRNFDLWRDLVIDSLSWWDYRDHKSKGLVKEKFPDFRHKETGDGLWLSSAPQWVLPVIEELDIDVKIIKAKQVQRDEESGERKNEDRVEDSWTNLVGNPKKWWDNRLNKRSPNAPDFRHKETGEGLWVNKAPVWALSKLPPL